MAKILCSQMSSFLLTGLRAGSDLVLLVLQGVVSMVNRLEFGGVVGPLSRPQPCNSRASP